MMGLLRFAHPACTFFFFTVPEGRSGTVSPICRQSWRNANAFISALAGLLFAFLNFNSLMGRVN